MFLGIKTNMYHATFFVDQQINYKFEMNCQPKEVIVKYHTICFHVKATLAFFSFCVCVSHNSTAKKSLYEDQSFL